MGRALGLLLFVGLVGFVVFLLLDTKLGGGGAAETELDLAEGNEEVVRALDEVVEDALGNARRAADLAVELEEAAAEATRSADAVLTLADDNDAARASAKASRLAAEDSEAVARLMRAYSDRMLARMRETEGLTEDAEAVAQLVEAVEETQAEAAEAARKAAAARAELAEAEGVLDEARSRAGDVDPQVADYRSDPVEFRREDTIVILNDPEAAVREDEEDVGRRLDEIFPEGVIDYEEEDVPYGERG